MKTVLQSLASGQSELVEAPAPQLRNGGLLINTTFSLISTGTERMLLDFGRAGWLEKARGQPEKVRQVIDKIATDGISTTLEAVHSKLGQPIQLGYCNVGKVCESSVEGFRPGDRVVSNGPHADVVCVPKNLCARIPDEVSDEAATFVVVASIGLQGIRLAQPTLGDAFVVFGVGLIGLLTVQMLRAHGCRVLAVDFDAGKLNLAQQFGASICNLAENEDPIDCGWEFSRGLGVDGVIITASTKSSEPVSQAARMCRKRGRIVLVGVTGLELNRSEFYEKELTFQVSCSYGPGRYDQNYEDKGQDYPLGYVRWTEQRNFEAVLDMLASGALDVSPLISHRVPFLEAPRAYELLANDEEALGILLAYEHSIPSRHQSHVKLEQRGIQAAGSMNIGFVGAGNYASRVLIPAFRAAGATLSSIASRGGVDAIISAKKNGFTEAVSEVNLLLEDPTINVVAIATRHDSHARLAADALLAGKHVFLEKPLALNMADLQLVTDAHAASGKCLMVGFNRRFAPQVQTLKRLLNKVKAPKCFVMTMNAGQLPVDHWTQDSVAGGGRIIGEGCHYIDLMRFLAGAPITSVQARKIGDAHGESVTEDKASITLSFQNGSFGTIHYFANGGRSFPKERIEVFAAGGTLQLDNFRKLRGYNWPGFRKQNLWRQDKGQRNCVLAFKEAIESGGAVPIAAAEIFEVARVTIEVAEMLRRQR